MKVIKVTLEDIIKNISRINTNQDNLNSIKGLSEYNIISKAYIYSIKYKTKDIDYIVKMYKLDNETTKTENYIFFKECLRLYKKYI